MWKFPPNTPNSIAIFHIFSIIIFFKFYDDIFILNFSYVQNFTSVISSFYFWLCRNYFFNEIFFIMKHTQKNVFYTHSIKFYFMEFFESNFYNVTLLLDIHTCTCTLYLCIALTTRSCYGGRAVRELFPSACRALQTSHVYCTVVHTKKMGHS